MPSLNIYKAKHRSTSVVKTCYLGGLIVTLRKNDSIRVAYSFGTTGKHDHIDIQPDDDDDYYMFFKKILNISR